MLKDRREGEMEKKGGQREQREEEEEEVNCRGL